MLSQEDNACEEGYNSPASVQNTRQTRTLLFSTIVHIHTFKLHAHNQLHAHGITMLLWQLVPKGLQLWSCIQTFSSEFILRGLGAAIHPAPKAWIRSLTLTQLPCRKGL